MEANLHALLCASFPLQSVLYDILSTATRGVLLFWLRVIWQKRERNSAADRNFAVDGPRGAS